MPDLRETDAHKLYHGAATEFLPTFVRLKASHRFRESPASSVVQCRDAKKLIKGWEMQKVRWLPILFNEFIGYVRYWDESWGLYYIIV